MNPRLAAGLTVLSADRLLSAASGLFFTAATIVFNVLAGFLFVGSLVYYLFTRRGPLTRRGFAR